MKGISPCTGVCRLDAAGICVGCGRSIEQIGAWATMSDPQRQSIVAALDERSQADRDAACDAHEVLRVGLISDTHGLLRPEALAFLRGCSHIIHAGDIGEQQILTQLSRIAPLTAVCGNNDRGPWARALAQSEVLQVGGTRILVIHELGRLAGTRRNEDIHVIVSGHSHRPLVEQRDGILHVNPGSAGPRRFGLPIGAAELRVRGQEVSARLVTLAG
jgi:putative phosphoesterase